MDKQQLIYPLDFVSRSIVEAVIQELINRGLLLGKFTTSERDALPAKTGMVIYNTTTNKVNVYTTAWEAITSA